MNETVSLDIISMSKHLAKEVDTLEFLKEIESIRNNIERTKYRKIIIDMALNQAEKTYNELERYRSMMLLSNEKSNKTKNTFQTYGRDRKIETYA